MPKNPRVTKRHLILDPQGIGPDPPNADEFYAAAGRAIIAWARFENQLEWSLHAITRLADYEPIRRKTRTQERVPVAFGKKVEFWKTAFASAPALAPVRDEALKIIAIAEQRAKQRDALIHSLWGSFEPLHPLTLIGFKVRHKRSRTFVTEYTVTPRGLNQLSAAALDLARRMVPILRHLFEIQPAP